MPIENIEARQCVFMQKKTQNLKEILLEKIKSTTLKIFVFFNSCNLCNSWTDYRCNLRNSWKNSWLRPRGLRTFTNDQFLVYLAEMRGSIRQPLPRGDSGTLCDLPKKRALAYFSWTQAAADPFGNALSVLPDSPGTSLSAPGKRTDLSRNQ